MNILGWLMTASVLSGMVFWAIYCVIEAVFIKNTGLKSIFKPSINWGPLLVKNKRLATHLENLEVYHETQRTKDIKHQVKSSMLFNFNNSSNVNQQQIKHLKMHVNTVSLPPTY